MFRLVGRITKHVIKHIIARMFFGNANLAGSLSFYLKMFAVRDLQHVLP